MLSVVTNSSLTSMWKEARNLNASGENDISPWYKMLENMTVYLSIIYYDIMEYKSHDFDWNSV